MDLAYLINAHWRFSTSIGSGQRIPSFTDLYLEQRPGNVGNEFLQPENAWSYEGNIQYRKGNSSIKAGYFYRSISDFIDWVRANPSDPYSPTNFGKNKVHGLYVRVQQEFQLNGTQSFGYTASYNYLHPRLETSAQTQSKYTLESLKHQFVAGLYYRKHDFSLNVLNRLLKRELASAYNVLDIRINYQWQDFLLYSEITNLFNTSYNEAGAVPMPARWLALGLKYEWTNINI
jgi:iron complex outermembrane receptor protein